MHRFGHVRIARTVPAAAAAVCLVFCLVLLGPASGNAQSAYSIGYEDGFYIRSDTKDAMALRIGGLLQTDYRHYAESVRADNRFDIRRARLGLEGRLSQRFSFGLEFEFQGNQTNNLVDAYGEARLGDAHSVRVGQFKVPARLEWQTANSGLWFTERSMGFDLGPARDVGLMMHGSLFGGRLGYGAGLFNGDGQDGSARGSEEDAPEIAARLVVSPFRGTGWAFFENFQFGGSGSYSSIDRTNVDLTVKTTGMVGTNRSLYTLNQNTKFGVLQDVESRIRGGLEAAWAWGPFAAAGEVYWLTYTDLLAAGRSPQDAEFSAWYASGLWCLTGEKPALAGGAFSPIRPNRPFAPEQDSWGAFCLAGRIDHFNGDENWITPGAFVSVREADAYTAALTWILFPMHRLMLEYSYTNFSDPLRARVLPNGTVDYISEENALTLRYTLSF